MSTNRNVMKYLLPASIIIFSSTMIGWAQSTLVVPPQGTQIVVESSGTQVTWVVKKSENPAVTYEGSNGFSFTMVGGPAGVATEFVNENGAGTQRLVSGDPMAIYPLAVGKKITYEVTGENPSKGWSWRNSHSCEVTGQENITVKAGTFNSFVIRCDRAGARNPRERTDIRYVAADIGITVLTLTTEHRTNNSWRSEVISLTKK